MNRRRALQLMGTMVMGLLVQAHAAAAREGMAMLQTKKIVVIGAGLSGLAAARELQAQGHEVVVVEARDRIGGRIWTSTKWADMPLDLGATWIHGVEDNPITELAQTLQAERLTTSYNRNATFDMTGEALSSVDENYLEELREQVMEELRKAQQRNADASIRDVIDALAARIEASPKALRFINFILSGDIEQEYSGSADDLSAYWYDSAKEFDGDDELFVNGFHVITEYLARDLHIELGQVVREIQWGEAPVRVVTDNAEFLADQVLVTLPLGVLQAGSVRFTPELPPAKQEAIDGLGMGVLNKCYLRFSQAFWPTDMDWLEYIPANHGEWTEWVSYMRAANMPILLGFNAADRGCEIEAWSDEQIVANAMQTLRTMFGADVPDPVDYQITRWASDPFARGSYSFNPVDSEPAMRAELAKPLDGRLFFAGEASEKDYFSTAHGAYLSGLRAAREILA
ncbi:MAG: FAD-dependent oxidoreductase [Anaerolineae bacterium]|nr:FAD-dependent oxidoreductase [Anaerolineae bacterium]